MRGPSHEIERNGDSSELIIFFSQFLLWCQRNSMTCRGSLRTRRWVQIGSQSKLSAGTHHCRALRASLR